MPQRGVSPRRYITPSPAGARGAGRESVSCYCLMLSGRGVALDLASLSTNIQKCSGATADEGSRAGPSLSVAITVASTTRGGLVCLGLALCRLVVRYVSNVDNELIPVGGKYGHGETHGRTSLVEARLQDLENSHPAVLRQTEEKRFGRIRCSHAD